ncbi:unnamed protein product [Owenia fusiformis]|uniref:Uncharacterized protein n=1 Tax=Owenia fusiformis TaxID=6347 RepID=A0A8S4Q298_OWEFU|nr:unnamed protein product [Owenia fusiformis]
MGRQNFKTSHDNLAGRPKNSRGSPERHRKISNKFETRSFTFSEKGNTEEKYIPICLRSGPGPGAYSLKSTLGMDGDITLSTSSTAPTLKPRFDPIIDNSQPGPVYYPDPKITRHGNMQGQSMVFTGRAKHPELENTPGPGAYSNQYVPLHKAYSHLPTPLTHSLGPRTEYNPNITKPAPNRYSLPGNIGDASSQFSAKSSITRRFGERTKYGDYAYDYAKTPGPNTMLKNEDAYKKRAPTAVLASRTNMATGKTSNPAPGTYNPQNVTLHQRNGPKFSMGTRHSNAVFNLISEIVD